jgi:hypothetical protein
MSSTSLNVSYVYCISMLTIGEILVTEWDYYGYKLWYVRNVFQYDGLLVNTIRVITKLPNSEQSYKGKVKTHKYINRQNQSTTGKLWKL